MGMLLLLLGCLLFWSGVGWSQTTGTRPHRGFTHFNKLAVRNYLPCGGTNVLTGWVNHTDPQCQQLALSWLADAPTVLTITSPQVVENKQMVARATMLDASGGTITPNIDLHDDFRVDAIPGPLTIANPLGTGGNPRPSQIFTLCLFSNTPRALTLGSAYKAELGIPLPTSTTGNNVQTDCHRFRYNARTTFWDLIASTQKTGTEIAYANLPLSGIKMHPTLPTGPTVAGATTLIWFDDTTTECILWDWTIPGDYLGTPVLRLWYTLFSDTNTSHSATFDVQVWALKSGQSVFTANFDPTVNHCDDLNIPGTPGTWNDIGCALTANDGLVANDPVQFQICSDVTGTWTGDLGLVRARFEYAR